MIIIATAVTLTTVREDLGLLNRAGHPVSDALERYIAKGVLLVDEYKASANQGKKDLVINDLVSNQVQNWFINADEKSKGRKQLLPTTLTAAMEKTLDEDFVAKSNKRDDSQL